MKHLLLIRSKFSSSATLGELYIQSNLFCNTLEDTDRMLELYPDRKIYGSTAIPRGTYDIVFRYSKTFNREMPFLKNVSNFDGIMIHPGNNIGDTKGCILVGDVYDNATISNSKTTFEKLLDTIRGYDVDIEIV